MILAIDTATDFAGLALYDQNALWAEETWYAARNHSVSLMPRLNRMLAEAEINVARLEAIAVSLGPGSYTGVRVGVAIAKGLALPHNLSVIGVPTLDITAYPHRFQEYPVVAIAQAGRKRILAAFYERVVEQDQVEQIQMRSPYLTTVAELAQSLLESAEPVFIAGELNAEARQYLQKKSLSQLALAGPLYHVRRPGVLAELGAKKLAQHAIDDIDGLVPIYVKDP